MARRKETIWQNDFSFGAVRPEAEERDDTPVIEGSTKEAINTITLTTGQCEGRPGTMFEAETSARDPFEINLGNGRVYDLQINPTGVVVYDEDGTAVYTNASYTWTSVSGKWGTYAFSDINFWVVSDPDTSQAIIGSKYFPPQTLAIVAGSWVLQAFSFSESLQGAVLKPFWDYYRGTTLQPSARSGTITVTAGDSIFTDNTWDGTLIRYVDRQIQLTTRVSATIYNATVIERLPKTYDIVVASVAGFEDGQAVEDKTLGGKGIITGISGSTLTVLATSRYEEFASTNDLVGPDSTSSMSSVTAVSPAATFLWDMEMGSPVVGYPGHAARHQSRLMLCAYPNAPQAFAVSVPGIVSDFTMGENDGDGFVETIGADLGGDLRYIVSAEDLLFLTSRGLYYMQTRDGTAITPSSIAVSRFSRMGCASVRPVAVDDGAIFIDSTGEQVYAAVLSGDIYRSWQAQPLTVFHGHLVTGPLHIGATSSGSQRPEHFIYVTNSDGSVAVCQWDRQQSRISWRPWTTNGNFIAVYQAIGKTHAVVDRTINTVAKSFRERFEFGIYTDCTAAVQINTSFPEGESGVTFDQGVTAFATHLTGESAAVYFEGWDMGDGVVNASGKPEDAAGDVLDYPDYVGIAQVGLAFSQEIVPWSRRSVRTQRGTRDVKRLIELLVTVQDATGFKIGDQEFGFYEVGEDLSTPPPFREKQYRIAFADFESYERKRIKKERPGPFRLTKLGYRVVV